MKGAPGDRVSMCREVGTGRVQTAGRLRRVGVGDSARELG